MGGRGSTSSRITQRISEWKQAERDAIKPQHGLFSKDSDTVSKAYHDTNEARGKAHKIFYDLMRDINNKANNPNKNLLKFNDIQQSVSYFKDGYGVELLNGYSMTDGGKVIVNRYSDKPYETKKIIAQKQFNDPVKALNYALKEIDKVK